MEVISNSIPTYLPENRDASDRSVCFQIIQSHNKIFCLETRPTQFSYVYNATRMEPGNSICIFLYAFSLIQRVLCKMAKEKVSTVILITPAWQTRPWYLNLLTMSFSQSFLFPMSPGVLKNPKGEDHPLVKKQIFRTTGLEGYRKTLVKSGILERVAHLIVNSKRQS